MDHVWLDHYLHDVVQYVWLIGALFGMVQAWRGKRKEKEEELVWRTRMELEVEQLQNAHHHH